MYVTVFDIATGKVFDCEAPKAPEALAVCLTIPPFTLHHPEGDHHLDDEPGVSHSPNTWTSSVSNGDGTRTKSCGEWHAELSGYSGNFCENVFAGGAYKTVTQLWIYRCKTTTGGVCDSGHWTTGLVKSFLTGSSWQFWNNFKNGIEQGACNGQSGSGTSAWKDTGYVDADTNPACLTGIPKGYWGGGARYVE